MSAEIVRQHTSELRLSALYHGPMRNKKIKKKRVPDKRDEGKRLAYEYGDDSTYKSEQRVCRFPHLPSSRDITEVADSRAGVV